MPAEGPVGLTEAVAATGALVLPPCNCTSSACIWSDIVAVLRLLESALPALPVALIRVVSQSDADWLPDALAACVV